MSRGTYSINRRPSHRGRRGCGRAVGPRLPCRRKSKGVTGSLGKKEKPESVCHDQTVGRSPGGTENIGRGTATRLSPVCSTRPDASSSHLLTEFVGRLNCEPQPPVEIRAAGVCALLLLQCFGIESVTVRWMGSSVILRTLRACRSVCDKIFPKFIVGACVNTDAGHRSRGHVETRSIAVVFTALQAQTLLVTSGKPGFYSDTRDGRLSIPTGRNMFPALHVSRHTNRGGSYESRRRPVGTRGPGLRRNSIHKLNQP